MKLTLSSIMAGMNDLLPPKSGSAARTALVTGASIGLGRAVTRQLAERGWRLVIDARRPDPLTALATELADRAEVVALPGDVTDPEHRSALMVAAGGRIDLLINNASELGASPLPPLRELGAAVLDRLWQVNVAAPLALIRAALPVLTADAVVINISSDAAVEHYQTWGGYAATKAALDHLTLTLAAEEPAYTFYAVDPGDRRTAMHQAAFPGEDISDRPEPEAVAPDLIALIDSRLPSGRYRLADLAAEALSSPPTPTGSAAQPLEQSRR
jgi:NAD(P)-dependent dehydrogenase (short-subunit alcohol dehydrogenase family)